MIVDLKKLAEARLQGKPAGITSVCSAHPLVLRAALRRGAAHGDTVLIEATCNQVNQFGGYTGMTPADFIGFVSAIAKEENFDLGKLIFGGDHLGPNPWRKLPAGEAMRKAEDMVVAYVSAGFTKIHLDASMGCAGEPPSLDDETIAKRAARLAKAAERAAADPSRLTYVIGTEVPVPGGADHALDMITPTRSEAAKHTIAVHRRIFAGEGLSDAFTRVIALVVQPGVEFGNENVIAYRPELATRLTRVLDEERALVFEAHSTDYQDVGALSALVHDGFPILKVGPGLTFALREAYYALDLIAGELDPVYGERSLAKAMETLMLSTPGHWLSHYHGDAAALKIQRHYSYSDRIRYYWAHPDAQVAVDRLMQSLNGRLIPETLLRQFLPRLALVQPVSNPEALLISAVDAVLEVYAKSCRPADA